MTFMVTQSKPVEQRGPVFRKARHPAGAQGRGRARSQTQPTFPAGGPLANTGPSGCLAAPWGSEVKCGSAPAGCRQAKPLLARVLKKHESQIMEEAERSGADLGTRLLRGTTVSCGAQPRVDAAASPFLPKREWPSWASRDGRGQRDTGRKMDSPEGGACGVHSQGPGGQSGD